MKSHSLFLSLIVASLLTTALSAQGPFADPAFAESSSPENEQPTRARDPRLELRQEAQEIRAGAEQLREDAKNQRLQIEEKATTLRNDAAELREQATGLKQEAAGLRQEATELKKNLASRAGELRIERRTATQSAEAREEFRLQTKNVAAVLRGATVEQNEETGVVTLTTPSGVVHELQHLPDQALERILAVKSGEIPPELQEKLEISSTEDGVEYSLTHEQERRFLGLFRWSRQETVTLDDSTGEVTVTPEEGGFFQTLLDRLSR